MTVWRHDASTDVGLGAIQLAVSAKANPFHTSDLERSHIRPSQVDGGLQGRWGIGLGWSMLVNLHG